MFFYQTLLLNVLYLFTENLNLGQEMTQSQYQTE